MPEAENVASYLAPSRRGCPIRALPNHITYNKRAQDKKRTETDLHETSKLITFACGGSFKYVDSNKSLSTLVNGTTTLKKLLKNPNQIKKDI